MAAQVTQDVYDYMAAQRDEFLSAAVRFAAGRDDQEAQRVAQQKYADGVQIILDDLEVITG